MTLILAAYNSKHGLSFMTRPWDLDRSWTCFRVGTCHGIYRATDGAYEILGIFNEQPGNGHFDDAMGFFEHSARRDRMRLMVVEIWNDRLRQHLLRKRGFRACDVGVVKEF